MTFVDANILLYAEDQLSPHHEAIRYWWDKQLSGSHHVCLCWPVINAFLRIGTNSRVFKRPLLLKEATGRIQTWFEQPCVRLVSPTEKHWEIFQTMLHQGQAVANLIPDAHIAALAVEHGCTLFSTDADFARFPKVKWVNPIDL